MTATTTTTTATPTMPYLRSHGNWFVWEPTNWHFQADSYSDALAGVQAYARKHGDHVPTNEEVEYDASGTLAHVNEKEPPHWRDLLS